MIHHINAQLWSRLASSCSVPSESIRLFRPLLCAYILVFAAPNFSWLDSAPQGLFDPPQYSLASISDALPPAPLFSVLDILALLALVGVLAGVWLKGLTVSLIVLNIVGLSFSYTFGKIDHTQVFLLVVLVCMVYCNWGDQGKLVSLAHERRCQIALAAAGGTLAFAFMTAAAPKLLTWIDFDTNTSGILSWYFPGKVSLWRTDLLAGVTPHIPLPVLEMLDLVAPFFEVAAILAVLWGRRPWLVYLLVASVFHLLNVLLLDIPFVPQAFLYLLFVDLSRYSRVLKHLRLPALAVGLFVAAWHVVIRILGTSTATFLVSDALAQLYALQWTAVVTAPVVGVLVLIDAKSDSRRRLSSGRT